MRILHTADWHLGKRLDYYSRLEEQKEVIQEIRKIAKREQVDLVIVAGDLFDNFNPSNEAMELLYNSLSNLGQHGRIPVIAIAGNHDSPERINVPDIFARNNGVIFIGKPTDKVPKFKIDNGFEVTQSEVGFIEVKLPQYDYPVRVLHTAFANENRLKEYFGEDKQKSLAESLAKKWSNLADKYCNQQGVNILTTHLFIQKRSGKKLNEPDGEKPLNIGNADVVYSDVIPPQIQYAALGHLHSYMDVGTHQPVIYSSAPLCYSFSEAGQQRYVAIADFKPNQTPEIQRIPLQKGKKLVRKTFDSVEKTVTWLSKHPNCLVELTLQTDNFLTAEEQQMIQKAHDGIIFLIPEVKNSQFRQGKTQEIDLQQDIDVLFTNYFKRENAGQEPNEEIMQLFNEILNA